MRYVIILLLGLAIKQTVYGRSMGDSLTIGSKAPAMLVTRWMKGEPVTMLEKGKVYVIGFTRTDYNSCRQNISRFSELAKKYANNALFINIYLIDRDSNAIEKYINEMSHKMDYTVGIDNSKDGMWHTWLKKAVPLTIPGVFIINREGIIAWVGSPGTVLFDEAIGQVLSTGSVNDEKIKQRSDDLAKAVKPVYDAVWREGSYSSALRIVDSLLAKYPWNYEYGNLKLWLFHKYDRKAALAFAKKDMAIYPEKNLAGDDKTIYRSVLLYWSGQKQSGQFNIDGYFEGSADHYYRKPFQSTMTPLYGLYDLAYFGSWYWGPGHHLYGKAMREPVLELRDTSLFAYDYGTAGRIIGVYNYSLSLPPEKVNREFIMKEMQAHLKSAFGYDVRFEERMFPIWKLVAQPGTAKKLQTKGGERRNSATGESGEYISIAAGFWVRNYPVIDFLHLVSAYIDDHKVPFIDGTAIKTNIDFTIDADLTDVDDIRKELKKQGLDLVKGERKMKVLVIRDAKD